MRPSVSCLPSVSQMMTDDLSLTGFASRGARFLHQLNKRAFVPAVCLISVKLRSSLWLLLDEQCWDLHQSRGASQKQSITPTIDENVTVLSLHVHLQHRGDDRCEHFSTQVISALWPPPRSNQKRIT